MPHSSYETSELEGHQRVADQLDQMREELGDALAWDSDEAADYNYLYVPDRLLVDEVAEERFLQVFDDRADDMPFAGLPQRDESRTVVGDLRTYNLPPERANPSPSDVLRVMEVMDDELEDEEQVSLEHYVHLAANGNGRLCPATEPEETGLTDAWPRADGGTAGDGVDVVIVDTRWLQTVAGPPWAELLEYDGHGSFAEGVVLARAPGASIATVPFPLSRELAENEDPEAEEGRHTVVSEGYLVEALSKAIGTEASERPRIITMQAGCHTRRDRPLKAFERLWTDRLQNDPNTVFVCAAGNDATSAPLFPAASPWSWGVGSLDANDAVSSFSNFGPSADVFVLGRNHVNQFPMGHYWCREAPNVGTERLFSHPWARWSGTSFAAPMLAGLLAAHLSQGLDRSPREEARNFIRHNRVWRNHPLYGHHRVIGLDQVLAPDFSVLPALP